MRYLLLLIFLTFPLYGSVPLKLSDEQLAAKADHVFVAHVVGVDMIDSKGRKITDDDAMTGPGLKNTIRLRVKIDETLVSNAKKIPKFLYIPLDPSMHFRLGQVKDVHSGDNPKFLLLLAGSEFTPPRAGVFHRDLKKKSYFVKRVKKKHAKTKNPG